MYPFESEEIPAGLAADQSWPLLGSVFTESQAAIPVVPSALYPPAPRALPAQERDALLEGHWTAYDNSRLSAPARYRCGMAPAAQHPQLPKDAISYPNGSCLDLLADLPLDDVPIISLDA